nr:uncharacterized protein LOC105709280 [Aotus nancymaae]
MVARWRGGRRRRGGAAARRLGSGFHGGAWPRPAAPGGGAARASCVSPRRPLLALRAGFPRPRHAARAWPPAFPLDSLPLSIRTETPGQAPKRAAAAAAPRRSPRPTPTRRQRPSSVLVAVGEPGTPRGISNLRLRGSSILPRCLSEMLQMKLVW